MNAEPCREQAQWSENVVGSRAWILAPWRVEVVASFDSCVYVQVKAAVGDWDKGKEVGGERERWAERSPGRRRTEQL